VRLGASKQKEGSVPKRTSTEPAPDWPALMPLAMAAQYLSVDESSFQKFARANALRPVDLGLELERWRRSDLDRLIAKLPSFEHGMRLPAQLAAAPSQPGLSETDLDRIATRLQARTGATLPQACTIRQTAEAPGSAVPQFIG
jgi:hypothetical protein